MNAGILEGIVDEAGRVRRWPKKMEQKRAVLEYLTGKFEKGRIYSEKEVNEIIIAWHSFVDFALLRREMVEGGLIERTRDCREYRVS